MSAEVRGQQDIERLFSSLGEWVNDGSRHDVDKGVQEIAKDIREKISRGQDADGSPLQPLSKATLDGPVRRDDNPTLRSHYGQTPLYGSGKTAQSITGKKSGIDSWEVSSDSDLGDAILASNAKTIHHGNPFGGDTPKPIRDPLRVTEKQMDVMEDSLLEGIDKALNG